MTQTSTGNKPENQWSASDGARIGIMLGLVFPVVDIWALQLRGATALGASETNWCPLPHLMGPRGAICLWAAAIRGERGAPGLLAISALALGLQMPDG